MKVITNNLKHFVGEFTADQCKNGEDKIAIDLAKKTSGFKYIQCKQIKKNGVSLLKVWLEPNY